MKTILHFAVVLAVSLSATITKAQQLELLDGKILLDQKAIFSYDQKTPNNEFHLYRLNSEKSIVAIKHVHHMGKLNSKKEYKILTFSKQEITINSVVLAQRNWKFILQLLLDEKVITINGNINLPNLEKFAEKYDEKINSNE
jgi:hypothetical protein